MHNYVVKPGDYLSKIAKEYGFADWKTLWNHPQNAELKKKRQNPNVLYPGDKLVIPEKKERQESGATEQHHKFVAKHKTLKLRLVLKDLNFKPLANKKCVLHVDGQEFEITSQANGLVEHEIKPTAERARLLVEDDKSPITVEVPIEIGKLHPVDEVSGQKARLNNLGYFAGPLEEGDEALFTSAVEEFQCDNKLTVDGKCGPKTQAKLNDIHGC
jgi:N-acetylmuramoyl-L-alanine amidase